MFIRSVPLIQIADVYEAMVTGRPVKELLYGHA